MPIEDWVVGGALTAFQAYRRRESAQREVDAILEVVAEDILNSDADYRISIFWPNTDRTKLYLYRRYRYGDGFESNGWFSSVSNSHFGRGDKGGGLAGKALSNVGRIYEVDAIPEFDGSRAAMELFHVASLGLTKEAAENLSPYMMDVHSILCYGIAGRKCKKCVAVMSIDCQRPKGFDEAKKAALVLQLRPISIILDE